MATRGWKHFEAPFGCGKYYTKKTLLLLLTRHCVNLFDKSTVCYLSHYLGNCSMEVCSMLEMLAVGGSQYQGQEYSWSALPKVWSNCHLWSDSSILTKGFLSSIMWHHHHHHHLGVLYTQGGKWLWGETEGAINLPQASNYHRSYKSSYLFQLLIPNGENVSSFLFVVSPLRTGLCFTNDTKE